MERHPPDPDARSLEEAFFARQNAELLEKLRMEARLKERRRALRDVVPNADDALLDRLLGWAWDPRPSWPWSSSRWSRSPGPTVGSIPAGAPRC